MVSVKNLNLQQNWTSVKTIVRPKDGESSFGIALNQGPAYGRSAPMLGQYGRVITDTLVLRMVDDLHGDELGTVGHHI